MSLRTKKTCKDSPKPQRINNMGTTRNSWGKDRTAATTSKTSKGNSIIRRRADTKTNKYELTTKLRVEIPNYLLKTGKKLTSDKYILDIVTNGLRLDFKEIPENKTMSVQNIKEWRTGSCKSRSW